MGWTRKPRRANVRKLHRPDVESLEIRSLLSTGLGRPMTADDGSGAAVSGVDALIGATAARQQYGVTGQGMSVAVIDTGVNYSTPALGGGFGPGNKVVGGYDFAYNDPDPNAVIPHGTEVAKLIASADASNPGVAPGANIVALRVFDDSDVGDFNKVGDALQWVVDNHQAYNITVVNLSLSDGRNYTRNWFAQDGGVGQRVTTLVAKLASLNIPVVAATGNSYAGQQGSGFASIIPQTISVTATDDSDHLVASAQRLGPDLGGESATDIAAPSSGGTSFAAPLVSGAIVLMQQVYQSRFNALPSVDEIDAWLTSGATTVTDTAANVSIGRLDVPKALARVPVPATQILIPPTSPAPQPQPDPTPDPAPTPTPDPAPTTPPPPSPVPLNLWVNGQQVSNVDLENPSTRLAGMPGLFLKALQALKGWWGGSADSQTRVRVWAAGGGPGTSQTAGLATPAAARARAAAAKAPTARTGTLADALPKSPRGGASAPTMPRAWHSFVSKGRTR